MIRAAVAPFVKDAATIAIMTWRDNMWNEKEAPPSFPEVSATLLPGSHDSPTNYEFETAEAEGNKKGLMPTEAKPKNNNTAESPAAMVETTTLWEEPGGGKTSQKVPNENSNVASEETPVVTEEAHITSQMMRTDAARHATNYRPCYRPSFVRMKLDNQWLLRHLCWRQPRRSKRQ